MCRSNYLFGYVLGHSSVKFRIGLHQPICHILHTHTLHSLCACISCFLRPLLFLLQISLTLVSASHLAKLIALSAETLVCFTQSSMTALPTLYCGWFPCPFSPYLKARDRGHPAQCLALGDLSIEWLLENRIGLIQITVVLSGSFSCHPLHRFLFNSRTKRRENYSQFSKPRTLITNSRKTKYLAFLKSGNSSRGKEAFMDGFYF